jgi:virginiamycin B lyase
MKTYPMPDPAAGDPHTLVFDGRGNIWFTVQQGGFIGRLNMESGKIDLLKAGEGRTNPYGIAIDSKGRAWVNLFATNRIAIVDPASFSKQEITVPRENARTRRIAITSDDVVWYADYAGGMLGRIDPRTQAIREWAVPGGEGGRPYALVADDRDRLWFAETGATARLVGFDPKTEKFFVQAPVSAGIRHMEYHRPTRTLWFGTDANNIGRHSALNVAGPGGRPRRCSSSPNATFRGRVVAGAILPVRPALPPRATGHQLPSRVALASPPASTATPRRPPTPAVAASRWMVCRRVTRAARPTTSR